MLKISSFIFSFQIPSEAKIGYGFYIVHISIGFSVLMSVNSF